MSTKSTPYKIQICALGFPTPTVQWFKDGQPIASDAEGPGIYLLVALKSLNENQIILN